MDSQVGGSGRAGAALVALGAYAALISIVFLSPFALSPYAIQNDVYMGNLFLSAPFALAGVVCLAVGALLVLRAPGKRRMGWLWARSLLVAVVGATLVSIVYALFGGHYQSFGPTPINWPPYLNGALMNAALVVGLLVVLGGIFWGARDSERPGG